MNGYLHCFLGFSGIGPFGLTFHYADPYGSAEPSISYRNLRAATPRTLSNPQSSIFIEVCPYDNILSYPSDKPHRLVGAARLHCATPSALLPPREQAPYGGEGKQIPALSRWKLVSERRPFHSEQSEIVLILPASMRSGSVALMQLRPRPTDEARQKVEVCSLTMFAESRSRRADSAEYVLIFPPEVEIDTVFKEPAPVAGETK